MWLTPGLLRLGHSRCEPLSSSSGRSPVSYNSLSRRHASRSLSRRPELGSLRDTEENMPHIHKQIYTLVYIKVDYTYGLIVYRCTAVWLSRFHRSICRRWLPEPAHNPHYLPSCPADPPSNTCNSQDRCEWSECALTQIYRYIWGIISVENCTRRSCKSSKDSIHLCDVELHTSANQL